MPPQALSDLELASGIVFGQTNAIALPERALDPREALASACAPALRRQPCMVSFSGGRDSSAVLAVAARVAREQGLAEPIPVSLRFPGVASTEESRWQELVIGHLGLSDWVRIEIGTELDFLGPAAGAALFAHGLLWPANAHFHCPIFKRARGGAVLTGLEGDGLLGGWRWLRLRELLAGRARPVQRDALRVGLALAPAPVRAAALARRGPPAHLEWLRPAARRRLARQLAREDASEPRRWPDRVAWFARRRYLAVGTHSLALLAQEHEVEVHHPLLDPAFLAGVAAEGGTAGYGTRLQAVRALFADLLPAELIQRRTKGEFGGALWGPEARDFAARWDGSGIDPALVDGDRLRATWARPNPPLAAATLLQRAWLEARRSNRSELRPMPAALPDPWGA
jgi:asparagine synthetase B (glutamine-hydrolysing)